MKKIIALVLVISALMFAEYRYIMTHITPTYGEEPGVLCLEIFGQVDEYCIEGR